MRDRRPVDELSIEELEQLLIIRRREARQARLRRYETQGRRVPGPIAAPVAVPPPDDDPPPPQQHEAAQDLQPLEPPVTYDITDDIPRFEDELTPSPRESRKRKPRQPHVTASAPPAGPRKRAVWDKLLLGVEILGVAGILAILAVGGYFLIDENDKIEALEEKSAQIQRDAAAMRPTPTPPPELRVRLSDYVLPGGHVYSEGIGQFNLDELPDSIRPVAVAQLNAAPQADIVDLPPSSPVTIEIPAIGVYASIWSGDDWYQLQKGVGHYRDSANPGESSNMVLTAHNDIYGSIFRDLYQLEPGDEVYVEANNGRWYTYVVETKQVVEPTDVWVLDPGNEAIATLITCHPYQVDTHRAVVFARYVGPRTNT